MQQRHRNEDCLLLIATEICAHWKVLKSFSIHICRQCWLANHFVHEVRVHWTGHASVNQVAFIVHNCSFLHCRNLSKLICLLLTWHLCVHPSSHLTKVFCLLSHIMRVNVYVKCCSSAINVSLSRNLKVPSTSKMPFGMPQQHGKMLDTLFHG